MKSSPPISTAAGAKATLGVRRRVAAVGLAGALIGCASRDGGLQSPLSLASQTAGQQENGSALAPRLGQEEAQNDDQIGRASMRADVEAAQEIANDHAAHGGAAMMQIEELIAFQQHMVPRRRGDADDELVKIEPCKLCASFERDHSGLDRTCVRQNATLRIRLIQRLKVGKTLRTSLGVYINI